MFEKEIKKFQEVRGSLILEYNTGFVVIFGEDVLGVWNDRQDALKQGLEKYGAVPFLCKDITEDIDGPATINFSRNIEFEPCRIK